MRNWVPFRQLMSVATAAAAVLASVCAINAASAEDSSPWVADSHSAVRLLAGSRSGSVLLGGIAFQLEPGWKTYWRSPGDSGVPPRFDFSKSENVEGVTILWPAPMKFPDGAGGTSIGYHKQVVLPLRIVAKNADKPVILRATISYAVCEKLCVPVEAVTELSFASVASTQDSALSAALDTVPVPASIGDQHPITVREVGRQGQTVQVEVVAPDPRAIDLLAEGQRFAFELEGLPPGAKPEGAALKLTVIGGERAYEFTATLE